MKKLLSLFLLCFVVFSFREKEELVYTNSRYSVEERVEDLLARMTLEEKVAQLRIFHANLGIERGEQGQLVLSDKVKERLKYGIAGVKNPGEHLSPLQAAELNNQLQQYIIKTSRLGIPGLFVTEAYNGVDAEGCTKFGRPISSAATFNPELVYRMWDVIGREARLRGMHMCHSPEADLVRDPRFGRMSEAFGEDTHLTTEMVVSAIKGVQGDYTGLRSTHIGAVAKHFAGYGQVLGGKNFAAIEISPRTLIDEIYPPFEAAVKRAKALGVMASHGDLNGIASHGNPELLTGVLREQWGFEGYVVSDANDVARLHSFMHVAETPEAAAIMGLTAGVDIDLYGEDAYALLPKLVTQQPALEAYVDRAVRRVLRTKFILGLFENPYVDLAQVAQQVRSAKALALARESDVESVILLKNEKNILPLDPRKKRKIALLGPLLHTDAAASFSAVAGNALTVFADKGFELTDRKQGIPELLETPSSAIDRMVKTARKADVVVLFLGGDEFTAKEAFFNNAYGDRASIDPVGKQDELVQKVKALGKPVIVVLKHRRTLSINTTAKEADAILDCWDLSEFGEEAIARIIYGEVSPSGKLPVTVPRSIGQLPFHYSQKEINNKKGYLFQENGPLYPFGFGLSYASFDYSNLKLSNTELTRTGTLTAAVEVTNMGAVEAKEVVQLYIKDIIGSMVRPDKELKAFRKISLKPGETRCISFEVKPEMLAFTGLAMQQVIENGAFEIMVGGSSATGLKAGFKVVDTLTPTPAPTSEVKAVVK